MQIIDVPVKSLKPYGKNPRKNDKAVEYVANSIRRFGFRQPIVIDSNFEIVCGHTRWKASKVLGLETVPCVMADDLTPEEIAVYRLADNKTAEVSDWDYDLLEEEFNLIDPDEFDLSDYGFFGDFEQDDDKDQFELQHSNKGALASRFIVPPFSVLDTKTGAWKNRNAEWLKITGDLSETRDTEGVGGAIGHLNYLDSSEQGKNGFTSNFDPVLAEIMYFWFCPKGGRVLDPFGGEQTKGVVAGEIGLDYTGMEIRQEQVDLNAEITAKYPNVRYICGDSNNIGEALQGQLFDFCFTSPPYYDLECYSAEDMSALGTYEEFLDQYKNIFKQCYDLLEENSFCVLKVGEIRNKKTGANRCFVPDTVKIMTEIGFTYYNDIVLLNPTRLAAIQANRSMRTRKVVKCHQNIPVFYKGNLKKIQDKLPPIEYTEEDLDE